MAVLKSSRAIAAMCTPLIGGLLCAPAALADDPLDPIKAAVQLARARTACQDLSYSGALEAIAQARARGQNGPGYNGTIKAVLAVGDPEPKVIEGAFNLGARAAVGRCEFTEYGVGFVRDEAKELDWVAIIFGTPAPAAPPPPPPAAPAPAPAPAATAPPPAADPPTDAIRVSFDRGLTWTVNVTNSADLPGQCTFVSKNPSLPGTTKNFAIDRKGTANFGVLAPPPFSTYHVVVPCHGTFNGKDVEFGHVEQEVSA